MAEPPIFADHIPPSLSGSGSLLVGWGRNDNLVADQLVVGPIGWSRYLILVHNLQSFQGPKYLIHIPANLLGVEEDQTNSSLWIDDENGSYGISALARMNHPHLCGNLALIIGDYGEFNLHFQVFVHFI